MMKDAEKLDQLKELIALPSECEWVEFKSAKNDFTFDKIGEYFSALSNEANLNAQESGWLVFGVNKDHKVVGTNYRPNAGGLESLKNEIAQHTALNFTFRKVHELAHEDGRVLMFEIPAAPRGVPMSWQGHFYGRDGESLGPLKRSEYDFIRGQGEPDWSAEIVKGATVKDLDPRAIAVARERFKTKNPKLSGEVGGWDDPTFLNKSKLTRNGEMTRAALLLLGKNESSHWLSPSDVRMTWVLKGADGADLDYAHFGPPYLLNSEELYGKIRNITYRLMPDGTLFPIEVLKYDTWVLRELLHNCIAHQDYSLGGRITIVERDDSLTMTNLGVFIPQSVERIIQADCPPDRYRNPFLAEAMVQLNMIDTIGSGIPRVFRKQKERGFPMPDYDLSEVGKVVVSISGKVIDENYTRALLSIPALDLEDAIALDKVQKRRSLTDAEQKRLKQKKLIEGRRPSFYVSATVAKATGREVEYVLDSGLDDNHYKNLVLKLIREFGPASPKQISKMLLPKLPGVLSEKQKKAKVRNLVQEMAKADGSIRNAGGRGRGALWELSN